MGLDLASSTPQLRATVCRQEGVPCSQRKGHGQLSPHWHPHLERRPHPRSRSSSSSSRCRALLPEQGVGLGLLPTFLPATGQAYSGRNESPLSRPRRRIPGYSLEMLTVFTLSLYSQRLPLNCPLKLFLVSPVHLCPALTSRDQEAM